MKICWPGFAIALLTLGFSGWGCNQRTQALYKIEVERSCQGCDLRGINLARQSLGGKYRVSVSNQPLSTDPQGLGYADPVDLTGSDLREANLRQANLTGVVFDRTELEQADLSRANLTDATFVGADLQNANLQNADLTNTNFRNANLRGADLRGSDLSTADFTGANLQAAQTTGEPDRDR